MDNLTHTLIGANIARAFFKNEIGPEAVPILCWSSNLPDLDVACLALPDPLAITLRRTWGHSLFTVPLLAAGLAYVFKKIYPQQKYATLLGLCLLGAYVHVFFDLINSFGVRLTWPFSPWRPELAWVFIIDLVLIAILALPFALRFLPAKTTSKAAAAAACVYLAFCAAGRARAESLLAKATPDARFRYVFPEPLGPHRWRGVALKDGRYQVDLIRPWSSSVEPAWQVETQPGEPVVEQARQSPDGRRLEAFFKAPVWNKEGDALVRVYDLRFRTVTLRRGGFGFSLERRPDGGWRALR